MATLLAGAFWLQLLALIYLYVGYPVLAIALGSLRQRMVRKGSFEPAITILIAAYNESRHIEANLSNKRELDYPKDKLRIIVVSDCSTDETDSIVRRSYPEVELMRQEPRKGKTAALNLALQHVTSEFVVIADANSLYSPDALRALASNFRDPTVGYVTGRLTYGGTHAIGVGNRAYMAYESLLRTAETRLGSVVGVNGGIDAFRTALYQPLRDDELPDFALPLRIVAQGYRVVYEPAAKMWEEALPAGRAEYRMRVRVALRSLWTLFDMRYLLDPRHGGLFSIQLWSHKVLRYLSFPLLVGMYATALLLSRDGILYQAVAAATTFVVVAGGLGMWLERHGKLGGVAIIPYYYLLVTVASGHALWSLIRRRRIVTWKPRHG